MQTTSRTPGILLAYELVEGAGPVVVFCAGFGSDMGGTKALHLREFCVATGRAMLRFDYGGHGASGGAFADGCIGDWVQDAAHVITHAIPGRKMVLVGSSMGGWISLLLARAAPAMVIAVLLVAPAPDFTETLMKPALTDAQKASLARDGYFQLPSPYGPPTQITARLLDDGAAHLLLGGTIPIGCKVLILHGMRDEDVPWRHSLSLGEALASTDVRLVFIKDGDHRLSRPADLALLTHSLAELLGENAGESLSEGRV
ncbi:MAG: alpha/beta hydrolase [Acidocella sp.]|nr:alpha/beta hydrolase [Acidocella sp.]